MSPDSRGYPNVFDKAIKIVYPIDNALSLRTVSMRKRVRSGLRSRLTFLYYVQKLISYVTIESFESDMRLTVRLCSDPFVIGSTRVDGRYGIIALPTKTPPDEFEWTVERSLTVGEVRLGRLLEVFTRGERWWRVFVERR